MELYYKFYLSLIFLALALSMAVFKAGYKKGGYLSLVLIATLLTELYSTYALFLNKKFGIVYHLFCPVEYTCLCLYYIKACTSPKFKTLAKYSIPVFITFSLCVSYFLYHFKLTPSLNINLEGMLIFILYTHLLFNIKVPFDIDIYQHPDFWIAVGMLFFFGGVFVFLGLYPMLFNIDFKATMHLFGLITRPLNIVFYSCLSLAFIFLLWKKRYFI